MLLGNFIYEMSSWTRAIVIPLSIVHAMNPRRPVPAGFSLNELIKEGVRFDFPNNEGFFTWRNFFLKADRFFKFCEKRMWRGLRTKAIRRAEQWMLERTRYTDGVAAIYPPMMYVIMALDLLGYPKDHPDVKEAEKQFFNLLVDDERGFFFQPCFSVVWDTAIAAHALGESGLAPDHAMTRVGRLAAHQGSPPQRRLGRQTPQRRALGMVFRIRQRILSGYRRYRAGASGVEPRACFERP